jgi:hypothetical protein
MTTVHQSNYHNSGQYPSSCLLFKTRWIVFVPLSKDVTFPLRAQQVNDIYRFVTNITITIIDSANRPVFYLKHTMDNIRTSQKTHYVPSTNPTG